MKRLGRKTKHTATGHQECGVCHPDTKSPKALERRRAAAEVREEAEPLYPRHGNSPRGTP